MSINQFHNQTVRYHYSHDERGQSVYVPSGTIAIRQDWNAPTLHPSGGLGETPASQILLDKAGGNSYIVRRQGEG